MRIAHGQCVEGFGSKEAFYPVLQAIGQLCRGRSDAAVVDTLASHAPTWLVQFPALLTREHRETLKQEILGATRERMLREICEALETHREDDAPPARARGPPLGGLLHARPRSPRSRATGSPRSSWSSPRTGPTDVARSAQPLHALKRDLVARHLSREIVLEPLAESEIAQYLAQSTAPRRRRADVPEELASLLHRHTEGNPLFMIAVLEHLVERGLVERDRGAWRLRCPAAEISLEVPESLRADDRRRRSSGSASRSSACWRSPRSPACRSRRPSARPSADMDAGAFEECCEALARRGHILRLADTRQLPDGLLVQRYAFVHSLYRQALYARQAPARRAALHRRRGERLEAIFASALNDVALELAHNFEQGADWTRAVKYLRRAADVAAKRFSLDGARTNLQHALALTDRLPAAERAVVEIEILYSLAGIYLAAPEARVIDTLMLVREKAAEHGLVDVEVKALVDLAYPLAWTSSERGLAVIEEALRLSDAQGDPLTRARTRARCMVRRIMARGWRRR